MRGGVEFTPAGAMVDIRPQEWNTCQCRRRSTRYQMVNASIEEYDRMYVAVVKVEQYGVKKQVQRGRGGGQACSVGVEGRCV